MKNITIDGRTFNYRVRCNSSEWGESYYTEFYQGTESYFIRKYIFFGENKEFIRPKLVFTVYIDIESTSYTKKQVREHIERQIELLNRAEEIARGEIV